MAKHGEPEVLAVLVALLRGLRGWSRAQLSEASGIHKSQISRYELGKVTPSPGTQKRLAVAVGLPLFLLEPVKAFLGRLLQAMGAPPPAGNLPASLPDSKTDWKSGVLNTLERIASQARAELRVKAGQPAPADPPRSSGSGQTARPGGRGA